MSFSRGGAYPKLTKARNESNATAGEIAKTVVYWQPIRIFTLHYGNRRSRGLLPLSRLPCVFDEFPGKASPRRVGWHPFVGMRPTNLDRWSATNRKKFCIKVRDRASIVCARSNGRERKRNFILRLCDHLVSRRD